MSDQYFHFTLGPVQSFVAQARRTRDFWAGSFLLSWLSAVAMQAVIKQDGKIIFPMVDEDYLAWLENKGTGKAPSQGCVPNRFKGGLAQVPADFKPELVVASIQLAWQGLADKVWQQDLSACPALTRAIWERQVNAFWEVSWALSNDKTESNLLDRRKNWRHYLPPEEAGVKCMMMDGWQELSGINTPNAKGLDAFWEGLRKQGNQGIATDLRSHEYLCAIAFIKRRFVRCFAEVKVDMPNSWTLHGWEVKSSVPSVAYMAAAPWLAKVLIDAPEAELKVFHDAAKRLTQSYGEYDTRLDCIDKVLFDHNDKKLLWDTKSLDGNVFFEAALDNKNIYEDQGQAQVVKKALKKLLAKTNELRASKQQNALEPVSPFYAVLMMDGDSLGKQMSDTHKQEAISKGLENFTQGVGKGVEQHSGFLIYAGGDDVLALLPLEHALNCAYKVRVHYEHSFKDYPDIKTTISAAIEYAHIKMPLGKVLADAHHLLDEVAKDKTGRDAVAVRVWKPGGQHLEWAMPWKYAVVDEVVVMDKLAKDFQQDQQTTPFSNSFFFHVEERFAMLNEERRGDSDKTSNSEPVFDRKTMTTLIAADYLNSGVNQVNKDNKINLNIAIERIEPLLAQCFEITRQLDDKDKVSFTEPKKLNSNALQLIRFLAQKGVEHG
ncbi:MAG: type III-B CRISPR-associated protein Cas10/Cmr2 [Methylococcales bacterium]